MTIIIDTKHPCDACKKKIDKPILDTETNQYICFACVEQRSNAFIEQYVAKRFVEPVLRDK